MAGHSFDSNIGESFLRVEASLLTGFELLSYITKSMIS